MFFNSYTVEIRHYNIIYYIQQKDILCIWLFIIIFHTVPLFIIIGSELNIDPPIQAHMLSNMNTF